MMSLSIFRQPWEQWLGWLLLCAMLCAVLINHVLVSRFRAGKLAMAADIPNERSLHLNETPRLGGLGIVLPVLLMLAFVEVPINILAGVALVAFVSLLDDLRSLSIGLRMFTHFLAAALVCMALPSLHSIYGLVSACLLCVWFANCYNFMDGSDGLAGAQAVFGFAGLAIAGVAGASVGLAQVAVAAVGGALGFLLWNWPRPRADGSATPIFMGDVGSISLGLLAAALGLWGIEHKKLDLAYLVLCFFPFLIDASVTLLRRLVRGENITQAHRQHVYQQLVIAGHSHQTVATVYAVYMAFCLSLAYLGANRYLSWLTAGLLATLPYMGMMLWVSRLRNRSLGGLGEVFRLNHKMVTAYAYDVLAAACTWAMAYYIRFNFDDSVFAQYQIWQSLIIVITVYALAFFSFGLYKGMWHFASLNDLRRIALAATVATALIPLVLFMAQVQTRVPRSVLLLHFVLLLLLMAGGRLMYRSWKEHRVYGVHAASGEPVIVLGAGEQAAQLVHELMRSSRWRVVALLDDDKGKHGFAIDAVPVLGGLDLLPQVAERYSAVQAIIAMPRAAHQNRRRAASIASQAGLRILTMPSYHDLISGGMAVSNLRQVELEDLLGRDPIKLDDQGLASWLHEKTVMVTGAGGSIGEELCQQLCRLPIKKLVAFDISEAALYTLTEKALHWPYQHTVVASVGDVKDRARLHTVLGAHQPDIIFHAAAYKHVPLMENENAWQALRNNSLATYVLAQEALAAKVSKLVLISTDKAVNPTNIMGASKRLAERIIQACKNKTAPTQFIAVRFGNVLGSSGSVVPKFQAQIARHEPITLTDLEVSRYFMSTQEAAQLVLQAGLMGRDGEVFVMDMGEPVRIVDLARELIMISGQDPDNYPIEVTGLRPGEKLTESWMADYEKLIPTGHERLRLLAPSQPLNGELPTLISWLEQLQAPEQLKEELKRWVPEYQPARS